jgi:hypothetical protein
MTTPCQHATTAAAFIRDRAIMGREKYSHTLSDANLSPVELVQHAREEAADFLVYLTALQATMAKTEPARPAVTREAVMRIVTDSAYTDCSANAGDCCVPDRCSCARTIDAIMALIGGAP